MQPANQGSPRTAPKTEVSRCRWPPRGRSAQEGGALRCCPPPLRAQVTRYPTERHSGLPQVEFEDAEAFGITGRAQEQVRAMHGLVAHLVGHEEARVALHAQKDPSHRKRGAFGLEDIGRPIDRQRQLGVF